MAADLCDELPVLPRLHSKKVEQAEGRVPPCDYYDTDKGLLRTRNWCGKPSKNRVQDSFPAIGCHVTYVIFDSAADAQLARTSLPDLWLSDADCLKLVLPSAADTARAWQAMAPNSERSQRCNPSVHQQASTYVYGSASADREESVVCLGSRQPYSGEITCTEDDYHDDTNSNIATLPRHSNHHHHTSGAHDYEQEQGDEVLTPDNDEDVAVSEPISKSRTATLPPAIPKPVPKPVLVAEDDSHNVNCCTTTYTTTSKTVPANTTAPIPTILPNAAATPVLGGIALVSGLGVGGGAIVVGQTGESSKPRGSQFEEPNWPKSVLDVTGKITRGERIAGGTYGQVYRATMLDCRYAIKEVPLIGANPTPVRRVKYEAMLLRSASHEYIVPLYYVCETSDMATFVMPEMAGDLQTLIENPKCIPGVPKEFTTDNVDEWFTGMLQIALQMSKAVAHLHVVMKTLHRFGDIKPSNILLRRDDFQGLKVQLADFGFARQLPNGKSHLETDPGLGTVGYMPPEMFSPQNSSRSSATPQLVCCGSTSTDIFALGVTFFKMFTRLPVFPGYNTNQVITALQDGKRPSFYPLNAPNKPWAPQTLAGHMKALIESMWHQEPTERPPIMVVIEKLKEITLRVDIPHVRDLNWWISCFGLKLKVPWKDFGNCLAANLQQPQELINVLQRAPLGIGCDITPKQFNSFIASFGCFYAKTEHFLAMTKLCSQVWFAGMVEDKDLRRLLYSTPGSFVVIQRVGGPNQVFQLCRMIDGDLKLAEIYGEPDRGYEYIPIGKRSHSVSSLVWTLHHDRLIGDPFLHANPGCFANCTLEPCPAYPY